MRAKNVPTLWPQIFETVCLALIISLFTGCIWNKSLRGGESEQDEPVKVNLISKQPLEINAEDEKYEEDNNQGKFAEEQAFLFRPVKPGIDPCSGSNDCSHEKIIFDATSNLSADLFIVEFDDQGRLYYPHQMKHLFEFLQTTMSPRELCTPSPKDLCFDDVSLVVVVHGWRHNASFMDRNLQELRQTLYSAVMMEQDCKKESDPACSPKSNEHLNPSAKSRKVVGVYVGWRGAFIDERPIPILDQIPIPFADMSLSDAVLGGLALTTFWDRKRVAMDVALGSTRELFSRLGHLRTYVNGPVNTLKSEPDIKETTVFGRSVDSYRRCRKDAGESRICLPMRTLIIGHSFGSLAIYNAISASLIEGVTDGIDLSTTIEHREAGKNRGKPCNDDGQVESISSKHADLIILINPAFEGARFEPLYQASLQRTRRVGYSCAQTPVLAIITGTTDWATQMAFPAGRWFSTRFTSVSPKGKDNESLETMKQQEGTAELQAVGHIPRYMTHYLDLLPDKASIGPKCLTLNWRQIGQTYLSPKELQVGALETDISNTKNEWDDRLRKSSRSWPARAFCGQLRLSPAMRETDEDSEDPLDNLPDRSEEPGPWTNQLLSAQLEDQGQNHGFITRHPYNPIWVIRTNDDRIIDGHNGYLNPHMMGFIHQLYRDAVSGTKNTSQTTTEKKETIRSNEPSTAEMVSY